MEVSLIIKLKYDRAKDGTLSQFREKYLRFKQHIYRLQANGMLPRGEIRWSVEHKQPDPPKPSIPAVICHLPLPVHIAGTRLVA